MALRKPSGGSRGLVVGDLLRRLVARTLAQQFSQQLDAACHPHQYALSTRTGAEAPVHTLQAKTQPDTHLTVLSVDISAAYDTVSREAMLFALREVPQASALLPFVRFWYAREFVYVWAAGSQAHRITQAEGGEQGDPLMPALFALAFAPALRDLHADLRPDEQALAFLDDAYILAPPHHVLELHQRFERHALHRAQLRLNPGKTRVWNSAGVHPVGVDSLAPDSDVWVGNRALDSAQHGFVALGVPLGTPEFIAAFLETLLAKQRTLLDRLLLLADTQVAWLLLFFCAAPRAQYALRTLPPADTRAYAAGHDAAILSCLDSLLHADTASGLPALAAARAQLALRHGGLGLRSAERHAVAAFWASWANALPALSRRDRAFVQALACSLDGPGPLPHALAALKDATTSLQAPAWDALLSAGPPVSLQDDAADLTRGWQRPASRTVDELCDPAIRRELDAPGLALLDSQSGPHAASVFTTRPVSPELSLSSPLFRVLLLRRLRLPVPLTSARCRCRQLHDRFGDHLAACPRSGVLRARDGPLERAAARVCREAGATVALNVPLRDLNVDVARQDERCIEVIANGLALWGGSQLAVDTTLVSPLTFSGAPRRAAGRTAGAALAFARKAKERTYPELRQSARCKLVVLALELGGRWSTEAATFVKLLARLRARAAPAFSRGPTISAFAFRWSALISFAAARAFAKNLLSLPLGGTANVDGESPLLSDILADSSLEPPLEGRLPSVM